jgi:drug/metabolite transporter (DMT)-like permease
VVTESLLPAGLALLGAFFFGLSSHAVRLGLRGSTARLGSIVSIGATAAFYWLLAPLLLWEADWSLETLLPFVAIFALVGLVSPGLSLFLSYEANRVMGPTISGTLAATAPLFGAGGAVLVLGERLTPGVALGTVAIVAGVMALSWQGRGRRRWPLWAVLLPLGAALFRGGAHLGVRMGMLVTPAPFTGVLIAFSVSFLAVTLAYQAGPTPLPLRRLRAALGGGLGWFALTGVLNGLALLCQYVALSLGRVVVVSPMISTFPLFTLGISLLFGVERLSLRIGVGVLLVVLGVVVISTR